MKPLAIIWVLLVGVVSAALSFVGFFAHMRTGGTPMIVTPGPAVVFALATAILIWSGMAVRRLRAGKDTWIDAIWCHAGCRLRTHLLRWSDPACRVSSLASWASPSHSSKPPPWCPTQLAPGSAPSSASCG